MPVYDNPVKGLLFECDEKGCGKTLPLDFQGRNPERLWDRARERHWLVIDVNTCYCPDHAADQGRIVESIRMRVENLGRALSSERQAGLKTMTLPELKRLNDRVQGIPTLAEANTAVVTAICDSQQAQRNAEAQKWDAIDPRPATVTF